MGHPVFAWHLYLNFYKDFILRFWILLSRVFAMGFKRIKNETKNLILKKNLQHLEKDFWTSAILMTWGYFLAEKGNTTNKFHLDSKCSKTLVFKGQGIFFLESTFRKKNVLIGRRLQCNWDFQSFWDFLIAAFLPWSLKLL